MRTLTVVLDKLSSRYGVLSLAVFGTLLAETTVLPHVAIFGAKPALTAVVVAAWGLLYGPWEGFVAGLAAGLAQDLLFGQYVGLWALAGAGVGFLSGVAESKIFGETIWVPTAAIGAAVFAHQIVVWACLRAVGVPAPVLSVFTVGLPVAAYSLLVAPLVYRRLFLYRLRERSRSKEASEGAGQAVGRR